MFAFYVVIIAHGLFLLYKYSKKNEMSRKQFMPIVLGVFILVIGHLALFIPISARILCIADAFDAMISERSYKVPYSVNRSLAIIEEEAGRQFDPELALIFVDAVRNGLIKVEPSVKVVC